MVAVSASGSGGGNFGAEALVDAIQKMSMARTLGEIHRVISHTARRLTRANGSGLVLFEGTHCFFVDEDGIGPGWRGRRIPLDSCVAGWAIRNRKPIVIPDVREDIRLPVAPYWSTPVASVTVVPIRSQSPIGAVCNYWSEPYAPTAWQVDLLQTLTDAASVAIENAAGRETLEQRVRARTAELEELNAKLEGEIKERRRAEDEVRQLSLVDELTGLYNRRGFTLLAGRELKALQRTNRRGLVLYIDLDGLKKANDSKGHEAGDRLLSRAAAVLRTVTRETDVAARIGGDEFAVFMTLGYDHPPVHLIVERFLESARTVGVKWSIGATATPPERTVTLDDLLAGADEAMYRGRRARRGDRRVAAR